MKFLHCSGDLLPLTFDQSEKHINTDWFNIHSTHRETSMYAKSNCSRQTLGVMNGYFTEHPELFYTLALMVNAKHFWDAGRKCDQ
jgi:hypothetical protein